VRVEPAKRLSRVEPDYPPLQRSQGIEADVTLRLELSPRGEVLRVEIVRSADPDFDRSALAAAERERFSPETHDGQPVPTVITYSYRFRITP
jgi:protein TonB